MLDLAVFDVMGGQLFGHIRGNPALVGQCGQAFDRARAAQVGVAPARDQLTGLGEEFNFPDTALPQFQIMPVDA